GRRPPQRSSPTAEVDTGACNGAHPVTMRAPFPLKRVVAQPVAHRIQVDVTNRAREMTRITLHLMWLRKRLPGEVRAVMLAGRDRSHPERRQHLRERPTSDPAV